MHCESWSLGHPEKARTHPAIRKSGELLEFTPTKRRLYGFGWSFDAENRLYHPIRMVRLFFFKEHDHDI